MRPIPDHLDYHADEDGNILSTRGGDKPAKLVPYLNGRGFFCVSLWADTGERLLWVPVHELVSSAFLSSRPAGAIAVHGAHGRWSNQPTNLAWGAGEPQQGHGFAAVDADMEALLLDLAAAGESLAEMEKRTRLALPVLIAFRSALAPEPHGGRGRPRLDRAIDRRVGELLAAGWSADRIADALVLSDAKLDLNSGFCYA